MKPHVNLYLKEMHYDVSEYILCEVCEQNRATDIHHVEARGMGGTKKPDVIENLMGLCRRCHIQFGDKKQFMQELKEIHALRMKERGVKID